jgi:hypothetical protein
MIPDQQNGFVISLTVWEVSEVSVCGKFGAHRKGRTGRGAQEGAHRKGRTGRSAQALISAGWQAVGRG